MPIHFHGISGKLIPVRKPLSTPEELLNHIVGSCGRWQICLIVVAFIAIFLHGLNVFSSSFVESIHLNFTCKNGNGTSQCHDINGSKCKDFIFFKEHTLITFTEKFALVCGHELAVVWIDNSFKIGLIISYFLVGWYADRFGRKNTAILFIPLQCLTGILVTGSSSYPMLLVFKVINGLTCTAICLLTKVSVCDAVGNKWRTLALGFTTLPFAVTFLIMPYLLKIFHNVNSMIATVSLLPLILLVPLLYFKEAPNVILARTSDYDQAEDAIRKIGHFNKSPLPSEFRLRPVEVIGQQETKELFCVLCRSTTTRKALTALLTLWFFQGYCTNIMISFLIYEKKQTSNYIGASGVFACIISVALCHVIKHKIIIGVSSLLQNTIILALIFNIYFGLLSPEGLFPVEIIVTTFLWVTLAALDNLTPRMLPTNLRNRTLGLCFSIFHVGGVFSDVIITHLSNKDVLWIIAIILMIIAIILEILCSFWLWNVHCRELPDNWKDAESFQKYFKPTRYLSLASGQSLQQEIEVASYIFH